MVEYKLGKIGVYFRRVDGVECATGEYTSYCEARQGAVALQKELDKKYPRDGISVYLQAWLVRVEIPDALHKLVKGRDKKWGSNGYYWLGCNRGRYNGASLARAREYATWYDRPGAEHPVELTPEEIEEILK